MDEYLDEYIDMYIHSLLTTLVGVSRWDTGESSHNWFSFIGFF
jgi:hypothetical protein